MSSGPLFIIDTCAVVAVLENEDASHPAGEVDAVRELLAMATRGDVVLQRAAAFDRDWERMVDSTKRTGRLEWLASSPLVEPVASGVFRLDVSVLDGPDVLAADEDADLDRELVRILGNAGNAKGEAKRSSDRDHVIATVRSSALGLVTVDKDTLLKFRKKLSARGATVLWPSEALAQAVGRPATDSSSASP